MQTRPIRSLAATMILALVCVAPAGCGDDDEPIPPLTAPEDSASPGLEDESGQAPPSEKPSGPAESGSDDPRQTELERGAERTVRRFISALDAGDGTVACALLAEGALEALELPEPRGDCASSLSASIGFRDPRGLPVWQSAELTQLRFQRLGREAATAIATVATEFADREQVSIEDDIIYLTRVDGRWLVAKPSSTLFRAVGIADVPPSVLAPPSR
jgi:hypothetical protein